MFCALFVCTFTASVSAQLYQQTAEPVEDEQGINAILARLEVKRQSISNFEASFEQIKVIMPFEETELAKGGFWFKAPDKVLWEFYEPEKSKVLVKGERGYVIMNDIKQVQIFTFDKHNRFDFLLAGLGTPLQSFVEDFDIRCFTDTRDDGLALYIFVLTPKDEELMGIIQKCEITIDADQLIPLSTKVIEMSGDVTRLLFSDIRINQQLDDEKFTYVIPVDYEVIDYR